MSWFPVLVLCQVTVCVQSWSFVHPVRKIQDRSEAVVGGEIKDDWETKGKMLYAKQIIPTTSLVPEATSTTSDDIVEEENDDSPSTPAEDLIKPPEATTSCSTTECSTTECSTTECSTTECSTTECSTTEQCPETTCSSENPNMLTQTESDDYSHLKTRIKIYSPKFVKGNISFRTVGHAEQNKTSDENTIIKPLSKLVQQNRTLFLLQTNGTKKVIPKVHRPKRNIRLLISDQGNKLCLRSVDQSHSILETGSQGSSKTKRDDKNSFAVEGFWETPMTRIIGNGIDDVKVQYARPVVSNLNMLNESNYSQNPDSFIEESFKNINNEQMLVENDKNKDQLDINPSYKSLESNPLEMDNLSKYINWDPSKKVYSSLGSEKSFKKWGKIAGKMKPLLKVYEGIEDVHMSSAGKKGKKYGKNPNSLNSNTPQKKPCSVDFGLANEKKSKVIWDSKKANPLTKEYDDEWMPSNYQQNTAETIHQPKLSQKAKELLNTPSNLQNSHIELLELTKSQKPKIHLDFNFDIPPKRTSFGKSYKSSEKKFNRNWESFKSQNTLFMNPQQNVEINCLHSMTEEKPAPHITPNLRQNIEINELGDLKNTKFELLDGIGPKISQTKLELQDKQISPKEEYSPTVNQRLNAKTQKWGVAESEVPFSEEFIQIRPKPNYKYTPYKFPNKISQNHPTLSIESDEPIQLKEYDSPPITSNLIYSKSDNQEADTSRYSSDTSKSNDWEEDKTKLQELPQNVQNINQEDIITKPKLPNLKEVFDYNYAHDQIQNVDEPLLNWDTDKIKNSVNFLSPNCKTNEEFNDIDPLTTGSSKNTELPQHNKQKLHVNKNNDAVICESFPEENEFFNIDPPNLQSLSNDGCIDLNSLSKGWYNTVNKTRQTDWNNSLMSKKELEKDSNFQNENEQVRSRKQILSYSGQFNQSGEPINTSQIKDKNNIPRCNTESFVSWEQNPNLETQNEHLKDTGTNSVPELISGSTKNEINTTLRPYTLQSNLMPQDNKQNQISTIQKFETISHFNETINKLQEETSLFSNVQMPPENWKIQSKLTAPITRELLEGSQTSAYDNKMNNFTNNQSEIGHFNVTENYSMLNPLNLSLKEIHQQWDTANYVSNPVRIDSQLYSEMHSLDGETESHNEEPNMQILGQENKKSNKQNKSTSLISPNATEEVKENETIKSDSIKLSKLHPRTASFKKNKQPSKNWQKTLEELSKYKCEGPQTQLVHKEMSQSIKNSSFISVTDSLNQLNSTTPNTLNESSIKNIVEPLQNISENIILNIEHGKSNSALFEKNIMESEDNENDITQTKFTKPHHKISNDKLKVIEVEYGDTSTESELYDEVLPKNKLQNSNVQSHRMSKHQKIKSKIQNKPKSHTSSQDLKKYNKVKSGKQLVTSVKKRKTVPPINITIAMKNLFNRINPAEITMSNSSVLGLDGSLKLNIQLKDKFAQIHD